MYKYFSRKRDAIRFAAAPLSETGYQLSLFRDGKYYRVQEDRIGTERGEEILRETFPYSERSV